MNATRKFVAVLLLFCSAGIVNAQTMVDAGPNQTIYCSGSVQLTATPMNSWANIISVQPLTPLNSVFFPTPEMGFAVNTMGMVFNIFDRGTMWVQGPFVTPGIALYSVYFIDSNIGFIVGASGTIFRTTNSGNTWEPVTSGTTSTLRSIFFTSAAIGYIVGSSGTILKTTNGGTTWFPLSSGIITSLYSVFFPSPETGYATGMSGVLLKTTDAGATWAPQTTGVTGTLYSVSFPTPTTGFVSGLGGTILKTIDGTNWIKYAADSIYMETGNESVSKTNGRLLGPAALNSIHFTSATSGYIAGGYGSSGIFLKTIDGGTTWFEQPCNGSSKMTSLCFPTENVGYAVGGLGKIMKITAGEMNPLSYSWSPTNGLSDPYIPNPIANPTNTTTYTVYAYDTTNPMNSFTDTVKVSFETLSVNTGSDKTIGCEGSIQLDSAKTNYIGPDKLRYKWTPATGLNSDTIVNPIATVTGQTTYTVLVSTANGCSASGIVTVGIGPLAVAASVDKTVICSGSAQLSATTNYSGKSVLHYKWTPATGLSNDTIANPVATVNTQTVYTVNVTSDTGCSATGSITVKVSNLTANAGADKTVKCGETVQLDAVTTNYNGTGALRYKWSPAEGLSNDTIANPIVTGGGISNYIVTVTAPSGCKATDNVAINVSPLTLSVGADKTASCGTQVQLGVTSTSYTGTGLKYKWTPATGLNSDTIANPVAVASNITYTLTVTSPTGCTASDNVAISILPMDKPVINYVGINEKNKNIVAWTKPTTGKINSFNVYRETNVSNAYTKVGSVPFDSVSVYVDTISKPDVQSNKYKISIFDACGNETPLSDYHKTMHLSINKGINAVWNLIWEAYEGYPVSTYNIYRGSTPSNIQIIGSLSGSNTQFSDYTAPAGSVYYQIEAINTAASGVKQQLKTGVKSVVETAYSSRSNIATNTSTGIHQVIDISDQFTILPNPAKDKIKLMVNRNSDEPMKLNIYNVIGSPVITDRLTQNEQMIDIRNLKNGVYFIEIKSENNSGIQKLIVQK